MIALSPSLISTLGFSQSTLAPNADAIIRIGAIVTPPSIYGGTSVTANVLLI
jgi:hypothetical protein